MRQGGGLVSDGSIEGLLASQDKLAELISVIWHKVIGQVNKLIEAHERFGFVRFEEGLNPKLPDVLRALEVVDFALTHFYESGLLEYDEQRNALNAKQCILKIKLLAVAMENENQDEFEQLIKELQQQSKF